MACYHFCKSGNVLASTAIRNSLEEWAKNSGYMFGHGDRCVCGGGEILYTVNFFMLSDEWTIYKYLMKKKFKLMKSEEPSYFWQIERTAGGAESFICPQIPTAGGPQGTSPPWDAILLMKFYPHPAKPFRMLLGRSIAHGACRRRNITLGEACRERLTSLPRTFRV